MLFRMRHVFLGWLVCLALLTPFVIFAQVMQSSTYRVQSDSINVGGVNSSSASYKIEDTTGEVGTGDSNSASYAMHAGYQQMVSSYISISDVSDTSLANINGLTGGSSGTSLAWLVTTDSPSGYALSVSSNTTPALKSSLSSFADYAPSGADPDYTFSVPSSSSEFGFSPEGAHIVQKYLDDGLGACNIFSGNDTADKCWNGFSTTPETVAAGSGGNSPSGTVTTLKVKAESGSAHIQENGVYTVTLSVTAVTL